MPYFTRKNLKQKSNELIDYVNSIVPVRSGNLNINRATLLVIDMQKYFLDKSSHAFIASADAITPGILRLIAQFKHSERPVIFTRHLNNPQNAGMMNKWWSDVIEESSPLSEISDIFNTSDATIVKKNQYNAFHQTDLDDILKDHNTEQVIITGVMTNLCCETTARSAFMHGYEVFFPVDGNATFEEKLHKSSLLNLAYGFANIITIDDLLES